MRMFISSLNCNLIVFQCYLIILEQLDDALFIRFRRKLFLFLIAIWFFSTFCVILLYCIIFYSLRVQCLFVFVRIRIVFIAFVYNFTNLLSQRCFFFFFVLGWNCWEGIVDQKFLSNFYIKELLKKPDFSYLFKYINTFVDYVDRNGLNEKMDDNDSVMVVENRLHRSQRCAQIVKGAS